MGMWTPLGSSGLVALGSRPNNVPSGRTPLAQTFRARSAAGTLSLRTACTRKFRKILRFPGRPRSKSGVQRVPGTLDTHLRQIFPKIVVVFFYFGSFSLVGTPRVGVWKYIGMFKSVHLIYCFIVSSFEAEVLRLYNPKRRFFVILFDHMILNGMQ